MNKFFKKLTITAAAVFGLLCLSGSVAYAGFNPLQDACSVPNADKSAVCKEKNRTGNDDPIAGDDGILIRGTRVIAIVVGVAATIMIIVGGLMFILSDGNSDKAANGRKTIIYAIVGIVIAVLAGPVTQFLTNRAL